jgi:hypothetical protein
MHSSRESFPERWITDQSVTGRGLRDVSCGMDLLQRRRSLHLCAAWRRHDERRVENRRYKGKCEGRRANSTMFTHARVSDSESRGHLIHRFRAQAIELEIMDFARIKEWMRRRDQERSVRALETYKAKRRWGKVRNERANLSSRSQMPGDGAIYTYNVVPCSIYVYI